MDRLEQYRVFVQVAEMGSFIRAANALELPRATVSAAIQQLEAQLGVRVLHRTTRRVQLTPDGEQLLLRVRELLSSAEEIDAHFRAAGTQVSGRLNVDMPSRIARRLVVPALPALLRRYPRLQLGLSSTDRLIDPVLDGVDCVLRVGELLDSSLALRNIGHLAMINCASAAYLREHGVPRNPDELASHRIIGYASPASGRESPWEYRATDGALRSLSVTGQVVVNNVENYVAACVAGLGLIQIPRFDVQHLLDAGELVEVLPAFRPPSLPIGLLYPHRRQRSRRLAVVADWLADLMAPHLED